MTKIQTDSWNIEIYIGFIDNFNIHFITTVHGTLYVLVYFT